jgi:predicted phosphohydrolase
MAAILWASDLHWDHASVGSRQAFVDTIRGTPDRAVVLTGDITVASRLVTDLEILADAAARPVHFVLGNHDHYGSTVGKVRDAVIELTARRPDIQWLPPAGVVALDDETVLVGVDGWADGRHGDPLHTPLRLNDDRFIGELAAQPSRAARLAVKQALADADAGRLATLLERATATARHILVATHVPPFPEALPATGRLASADWLPLLVCEATGAVLRAAAAAHPGHEFLVLCGHTHVENDVMVLPNLRCRVAGAKYGEPAGRSVEFGHGPVSS